MIKKSKSLILKTVKPIIENKMSKAVKKQIETLNKEGNLLIEADNYSEALKKFDENINTINKIKIYDDYYLISLINKASVLISLTRYDESITLYKKIQKLSKIAPKRKDLTDLECTFGLALANNWLKNNDLAINYYIKALELTKDDKISKYYKEKIYDHLSSLYYRVNKYTEALKYHELLDPFLKVKSKSNQFAYLYNLFNIAEIYYLLNNYEKAKPKTEEVLELAMKHSGTTTENYSTPLYLLAKINYAQGDFDLAKEQFERVKIFQENQYDKLNTKLINTYASIGKILRINNKIEEEIEFLDTVKPIADKSIIFTKEISNYISINRKKALLDLKKYDSLIELLQKELIEVEKTNGDQSPEYSEVLHEIAKTYKSSSNYIKALEYYLRARKLKEKQLHIPNNNYVKTIANIAYLYKKENKTKEGISTYHKALRDIEQSIGNDNITYAFTEYYATLFDYELLSHYNFNSLKAIILKMIEIKKNIDKTKQNPKESDIVRVSINFITNKHSKEYPELQKLNPVISEPHSAVSNPDVSIEGY